MRSLFNGLAQVIVQSTKTAGTIQINAESRESGLAPAQLTITTKQVELRPSL
jgi:beta-galactosidase